MPPAVDLQGDPLQVGALYLDTTQTKLLVWDGFNWVDIYTPGGMFSDMSVGTVFWLAGNTPPENCLECNGALISRADYPELFSAIGATFGAGDGSTTFKLPDLRGEFLRGWDNGRGVDSGRAFGSAQGDAIRNITGNFALVVDNNVNLLIPNYTSAFYVEGPPAGGQGRKLTTSSTIGDGYGYTKVSFNASLVVPTAAENRPRNVALLACIKCRPSGVATGDTGPDGTSALFVPIADVLTTSIANPGILVLGYV